MSLQHTKNLLLVASLLGVLVWGCSGQFSGQIDPNDVRDSTAPSAAKVTKELTPKPEEGEAETFQGVSEQSDQAQQAAPGAEKAISDVVRKGMPNGEERNAILDRVNLGPGLPRCRDGKSATGPASGTESDEGLAQGEK